MHAHWNFICGIITRKQYCSTLNVFAMDLKKQGWWYMSSPHLLVPFGWYSHQMDAVESYLNVTKMLLRVISEANQHIYLVLENVTDPNSAFVFVCISVCFHTFCKYWTTSVEFVFSLLFPLPRLYFLSFLLCLYCIL